MGRKECECALNLDLFRTNLDIKNKIKEILPIGVFTMPKDEIELALLNINKEITKKFMKCVKW